MKNCFLCEKLNFYAKEHLALTTYDQPACIFYEGGYSIVLENVLKKEVPFGKTAFLASNATYLKHAKTVSRAVENSGGKFFGIPAKNFSNQADLSQISSLVFPEDVRAVVLLEEKLFSVACYICYTKNIPLIYVPQTLNLFCVAKTVFTIKNGNVLDRVCLPCARHVIIDERFAQKNVVANLFAENLSKIPALIDYRLYCYAFSVEPNKKAYSLFKNGLQQSFSSGDKGSLIESSFILSIANNLTDGAICDYSSLSFATELIDGNKKLTGNDLLALSFDVLQLFNAYTSYRSDLNYKIVELSQRADSVSKTLSIDFYQLAKSFIIQTQNLRTKTPSALNYLKLMSDEIKKHIVLQKKLKEKYLSFGGAKTLTVSNEKKRFALLHAGDTPFYLNGITLLRENGLPEE